MTNVKPFNQENYWPDSCTKQLTNNKYDIQQQTTTTELLVPDLGQAVTEFSKTVDAVSL